MSIVQLGGQTPLKLAKPLAELGVPILGTSVDAIDRAEDRDRFAELPRDRRSRPPTASQRSIGAGSQGRATVGYPVLVRPSYVLGGRAMEIVYDEASLLNYFERAVRASPDHPVLVDRFLEDAFEADVDALSRWRARRDRRRDAAHRGCGRALRRLRVCTAAVPAQRHEVEQMRQLTRGFARELGVVGLINVQYAIRDGVVYVLEVNPRASRTVPFVSKATGVSFARLAAGVMAGADLDEFGITDEPPLRRRGGEGSGLPLQQIRSVDLILGPEMRSPAR